ncbi:hypothetical protein IRZ71_14065 [Flavobacterium sp. ANB]|uniref:hypothetical protein n=1 Tax=unclassified Flavobacterium TaxID=196869 RepID=UPI0012B92039|nr:MULTISPECIES: hypothetical protein [unclassified Flavobacterium]MBF4517486.1 hypothetical protein [Flavobacterium sp. ANB]MTD72116.1 hypothetical protein [Flavobacterium sp. LC2016-13]
MNLKAGEVLIQKIEHTKKIPFRLEDLATIPVFTFIFTILIILLTPSKNIKINNYAELYYYFIIPILIFFYLLLTVGRIFIRWLKTKTTDFFLTNQRIIFCDSHSQIMNKSFELENLILNYREKANDYGYIIIGQPESIATSSNNLFMTHVGINFFEDKNIMYNIPKVKSVFDLIIKTKSNLIKNK